MILFVETTRPCEGAWHGCRIATLWRGNPETATLCAVSAAHQEMCFRAFEACGGVIPTFPGYRYGDAGLFSFRASELLARAEKLLGVQATAAEREAAERATNFWARVSQK